MRYVWTAIKLFLSALLVMFAITIAFGVVASGKWFDPMAYVALALFLFLAALPWVYPFNRPSRAVGFICVFFAVLCVVFAYEVFVSASGLPENCESYRRKAGCYMINAVYATSGRTGVGSLWVSVSGLLLWGACKFFKRASHERV